MREGVLCSSGEVACGDSEDEVWRRIAGGEGRRNHHHKNWKLLLLSKLVLILPKIKKTLYPEQEERGGVMKDLPVNCYSINSR